MAGVGRASPPWTRASWPGWSTGPRSGSFGIGSSGVCERSRCARSFAGCRSTSDPPGLPGSTQSSPGRSRGRAGTVGPVRSAGTWTSSGSGSATAAAWCSPISPSRRTSPSAPTRPPCSASSPATRTRSLAVLKQRLSVRGDLALAARLTKIFAVGRPPPADRPRYARSVADLYRSSARAMPRATGCRRQSTGRWCLRPRGWLILRMRFVDICIRYGRKPTGDPVERDCCGRHHSAGTAYWRVRLPAYGRDGEHPHHRREDRGPRAPARRGRARRVGARGGEAACPRQEDRPRADRAAAGRGLLLRAGRVRPAPVDQLRPGRQPPVRRRRGDRVRHHRRPPGVRVRAGLHRLRRQPGRGLRREDRQGDGPGDEDRLPADRHQRLRRRADPGGRGQPRPVRRDLPPQRPCLRRDPADLPDHGPVRGRRGLLPGGHRLHRDGGRVVVHVHHRPGRDQDRHRRGRHPGGARRRPDAQHQVRQRALPGQRRGGRDRVGEGPGRSPPAEQPRGPAGVRRPGRPRADRAPTWPWTR